MLCSSNVTRPSLGILGPNKKGRFEADKIRRGLILTWMSPLEVLVKG